MTGKDTTPTPKPAEQPTGATKPAEQPTGATKPAEQPTGATKPAGQPAQPIEIGGPKGPEPTRYGDWDVNGRCTDF